MKKKSKGENTDELRPEYDLRELLKGGSRGKYADRYREGHKVIIHKEDGTHLVQYFKLEDGAVMLEPDVRKYFPTSQAVNKVPRALIEIIPSKRRAAGHRK